MRLEDLTLFLVKADVFSKELKSHLKQIYEEITLKNEKIVRQAEEIERLKAKISECPKCSMGE